MPTNPDNLRETLAADEGQGQGFLGAIGGVAEAGEDVLGSGVESEGAIALLIQKDRFTPIR